MTPIPNLPDSLAREIYADLCTLLPPPAQDTPEAHASRDERAMTALAHLLPENAAEAELAMDIVAARFHAKDALRCAARAVVAGDPPEARRCRAQAASMLRQASNDLRSLMRMQAERVKAEAAMRPAAMERAGYWFRDCSVPGPEPAPTPVEASSGLEDDEEPQRTPAQIEKDVTMYRAVYPRRAAEIIAAGGFTPEMKFGPPDQYIISALLRGVGASRGT